MAKIAIVTDSNSGITQTEGKKLGIHVIPMPFYIDDETFYEDITLTQEEFYKKLESDATVMTSQPTPDAILSLWDELLTTYDEIVHIPMSSGLSGSCQTAMMLADDYDGRVHVVNNQRVSVTQRQSAIDARDMAAQGVSGAEIKRLLEEQKMNASIYIMVDTLKYLKKGGRITPAAAALGTLLKIKPVLQIQGEKLDAYAKARTVKQAKQLMIKAIKKDITERFGSSEAAEHIHISMAYTPGSNWEEFHEEVQKEFPNHDVVIQPLSLSISCHIGPGALAVTCSKEIEY